MGGALRRRLLRNALSRPVQLSPHPHAGGRHAERRLVRPGKALQCQRGHRRGRTGTLCTQRAGRLRVRGRSARLCAGARRRSLRRQHRNRVAWRRDALQPSPRDAAAGRYRPRAAAAAAWSGAGTIQHGIHGHPAAASGSRGVAAGAAAGLAGARRPDHRLATLVMTTGEGNRRSDWRPTASREMLQLRAALLARARAFFAARGVLEVDTPIVVNAPVTDVHIHAARVTLEAADPKGATGQACFLHTSPEYAMKRLLAAGSGDIYQICHVVRGLERGRLHNAEFTLIEWYRLGFSLDALMSEVETLVRELLGAAGASRISTRVSYREAFLRDLSLDPFTAPLAALAES